MPGVILEEANQLPVLFVERVVEPNVPGVRRDLHIDTLLRKDVMVVVVRGPNGADADHPYLMTFIHFHRQFYPEVIFHVNKESSSVIRLQERRCDLRRKGEWLLVVNLGEQQRRVVRELLVPVTESIPLSFTRKRQSAILNLGMSGGFVQ